MLTLLFLPKPYLADLHACIRMVLPSDTAGGSHPLDSLIWSRHTPSKCLNNGPCGPVFLLSWQDEAKPANGRILHLHRDIATM